MQFDARTVAQHYSGNLTLTYWIWPTLYYGDGTPSPGGGLWSDNFWLWNGNFTWWNARHRLRTPFQLNLATVCCVLRLIFVNSYV